jgi:hypothetical protein
MFRFPLFVVAVSAGLAAALSPVSAQADPDDPGTRCGENMVVNTHRECVPIGSFCTLSDGMIIGTIGLDGRCVIPGTNI